jgi:hypothetical protein
MKPTIEQVRAAWEDYKEYGRFESSDWEGWVARKLGITKAQYQEWFGR